MDTILSKMNYNYKTRSISGKSMLGDIQNELIALSLKLNLTEEQYSDIKSFVITEPKVLEDDNIKYDSVLETKPYIDAIDNKVKSYREEEETISKLR